MEFRKSQWTESISSLLRKTELNLIRIQTPYHEEYGRGCGSVTYHTSFYDNGEAIPRPPTESNTFKDFKDYKEFKEFKETKDFREDSIPIIQQEISSVKASIEKMLHERLRSQKKDIDDIGDRLSTLEIRAQDIDRFKEETKINLNSIEKKCLMEVKRIENSAKGFVTKDDLNLATEAITRANLNSFKSLEQEIQAIKGGDLDVKQEVFRMAEERMRDVGKKFVTNLEFVEFKDGVLREYEEKIKDLEFSVEGRIEKFKASYEKDEGNYEMKFQELKRNLDEKEEKIHKKISDVQVNIEKNAKRFKDDKEKIQEEVEKLAGLVDLTEIEYRLEALESGLKKIPREVPAPDLSNLVQKQDLAQLSKQLVDLEKYKAMLDSRIGEIEKKVQELESESSEIDVDLAIGNQIKVPAFNKSEEEKKHSFSNINIGDLGESDSDSQYISPHTSPMNQLNILKKPGDFEVKGKTETIKKKIDLIVVDEDPDIENHDNSYSKPGKSETKKVEIKHFPVESVKVESKKVEIKEQPASKGISLLIPEPDSKKFESSDSESSDFGLGLKKDVKPFVKPLKPAGVNEAKPQVINLSPNKFQEDEDEFGISFAPPSIVQKPVINAVNPVNPVLNTIKKPEPKLEESKVPNEESILSDFIQDQSSKFILDEIGFCVSQVKVGLFGKALVQKSLADSGKGKKIPDSIKGMNMHQLLNKESYSSSSSSSGSGPGSGSGSGSGSESGLEIDSRESLDFGY